MVCPKCFAEVQVVNGAVYCPSEKIYLSNTLEEFAQKYPQQEIIESKEKSPVITSEIQKKLSLEKYKSRFKFIFFLSLKVIVPVIVVAGLLYGYLHLGANG